MSLDSKPGFVAGVYKMGAYNATKYAVEALSDALRIELAPFGIQVVVIEPGSIATEFNDTSLSTIAVRPDSPYAAVINAATETRARFAKSAVGPEHVARAIELAVTRDKPRPRYVRPYRAYLLLWTARWLPTAWVDALQGRTMGLTPERLRSAQPTA